MVGNHSGFTYLLCIFELLSRPPQCHQSSRAVPGHQGLHCTDHVICLSAANRLGPYCPGLSSVSMGKCWAGLPSLHSLIVYLCVHFVSGRLEHIVRSTPHQEEQFCFLRSGYF